MTKIDYSKLFSYITRGADERTKEEVECWRRADIDHEAFFRRVYEYYRNDPGRNRTFSPEELNELFMETWRKSRRRKQLKITRWAAAAVAVLAVVSLWWMGENGGDGGNPVPVAELRTVDPTGVLIVTESGERLTTSQLPGNVARQAAGDKLEYTGNMEREIEEETGREQGKESTRGERIPTHTIVVPRGRTFDLVLADGTLVMLQPESKLTYPVRFDSTRTREVTLRGEAYFEVAKSERRFAVNAGQSRLEVYGTTFNLVSRAGEADEAVLLEGRVGVRPLEEEGETFLRPGERSTIDSTGRVIVAKADVAEYVARRNGYNLFNGKTIKEITSVLERYYDVTFTGEALVTDDRMYVLSVKQTAPLREVLDVIEMITDVKFQIDGKEVRVEHIP